MIFALLFWGLGCEDMDDFNDADDVCIDLITEASSSQDDIPVVTDEEQVCMYDVCDVGTLEESGILPVVIDRNFSDHERRIVEHAMIDYNAAVGTNVFSIVGSVDVNVFEGPEALIVLSLQDKGATLARTYVEGSDYDSLYVYASSLHSDVDWIHVMKHELVHLGEGTILTGEHTEDQLDIMYPVYNRDAAITKYSQNDIDVIQESIARRFGGAS